MVHYSLGEWQKAFYYYDQALKLYRTSGTPMEQAQTLSNIGTVHARLGNHRTAIYYYDQALVLRREVGDRRGESLTLNNLGSLYGVLGELAKAIEHFSQALQLRRNLRDLQGEAITLSEIGATHFALGDKQKALEYYEKSLPLSKSAGDRLTEAMTLVRWGLLDEANSNESAALVRYREAQNILKAIGSRFTEANALYNIARVERNMNRLDAAKEAIESSIKIKETLRANVLQQELRASFFASAQNHVDLYIDILMRMQQRQPFGDYVAAAFQASERSRARSLLELLTEARVDIRQGVNISLLDRERSLQEKLNARSDRLTRLLISNRSPEMIEPLKKEIASLTIEYEEVKSQIKAVSPHYTALTHPEPLSLKEIQQQVLSPDSLLLEYSLGEDRSYLWLVTQTSINTFELPKRAVIEEAAQKVYEILAARTRCVKGKDQQPIPLAQAVQIEAQYQQAAAALSQMLLGPVANQLGNKRLLIVSEGALQSIPFGALPVPTADGKTAAAQVPMIAEHEIVNLPSASTLGILRRELAGRTAAPKTVAVIADPIFDKDALAEYQLANKVKPAATAKPEAPKDATLIATATGRSLRDFGVTCAGMGIPPLPFSKQEARAIETLTPAPQRQLWLGLEANREAFLKADLTPYRIVHFATHGLINSEHPDLSGLVLSLVGKDGKEQNGILQLHEIYNLKLNADLVVLSACETAQGKEIRGEGRIGMARGFMYAGAARVLASLWKVDDEATSEFMKLFYAKMLREKMRPAAALRAAQNEMRKQRRWQSPYFWGGFVLQGEYQ